jgi:hypothetical protein
MTRYALRVDANQTAVISALRAAGATVEVVGKPLDLLVGIRNQFILIEVKDGSKVKSAQKPTMAQQEFFKRWAGYPWAIVDGPEAALRAIGCIK